jgi:hypothetical protein
MKIIKAAIVILALAASPLAATAAQVKQVTVCKTAEKLARTVMNLRQKYPSVTLSQAMEAIPVNSMTDSNKRTIKGLILDAYSENNPAYSSESLQQDAINTFVNKWSAKCWKNNWG